MATTAACRIWTFCRRRTSRSMAVFCCCELGKSVLLNRSVLQIQQRCVPPERCPVILWWVLASQVDNAATGGASAVLIYPDTKDYNYNKDTPLYGHVRLQSHDPNHIFSDLAYKLHLCVATGPPGTRRPLQPRLSILSPQPACPNSVIRPAKDPSTDHYSQPRHHSSAVRHKHTSQRLWECSL